MCLCFTSKQRNLRVLFTVPDDNNHLSAHSSQLKKHFNTFLPMLLMIFPENTKGILMFSWEIKMEHWKEIALFDHE